MRKRILCMIALMLAITLVACTPNVQGDDSIITSNNSNDATSLAPEVNIEPDTPIDTIEHLAFPIVVPKSGEWRSYLPLFHDENIPLAEYQHWDEFQAILLENDARVEISKIRICTGNEQDQNEIYIDSVPVDTPLYILSFEVPTELTKISISSRVAVEDRWSYEFRGPLHSGDTFQVALPAGEMNIVTTYDPGGTTYEISSLQFEVLENDARTEVRATKSDGYVSEQALSELDMQLSLWKDHSPLTTPLEAVPLPENAAKEIASSSYTPSLVQLETWLYEENYEAIAQYLSTEEHLALVKHAILNGIVYSGDVNDDGLPDGDGIGYVQGDIIHLSHGDFYLIDTDEGWNPSYYYFGSWHNGVPDGKGVAIPVATFKHIFTGYASDFVVFEGNWKNSVVQGPGRLLVYFTYKGTSVYFHGARLWEGSFVDNIAEGQFTKTTFAVGDDGRLVKESEEPQDYSGGWTVGVSSGGRSGQTCIFWYVVTSYV